MESAPIIRTEGIYTFVLCPRCGDVHRHGNATTGDIRGSDCLRVGLAGDYRIGELMDIRDVALALRLRRADIERKRRQRQKLAPAAAAGTTIKSPEKDGSL